MTVKTKEELKKAIENKEELIIIEGEMAKQMKSLSVVGLTSIVAVGAAIGLAPVTGGLSLAAAAPVAAITGIDVALIVFIASIGVAIITAAFKDYDMKFDTPVGTVTLIRKK